MKEICEQWNIEMKAVRTERRLMLIIIGGLVGIKLFL